jgi:hypothetical protein
VHVRSTRVQIHRLTHKSNRFDVWQLYDLAHVHYQSHDPVKWFARNKKDTSYSYFIGLRNLLESLGRVPPGGM